MSALTFFQEDADNKGEQQNRYHIIGNIDFIISAECLYVTQSEKQIIQLYLKHDIERIKSSLHDVNALIAVLENINMQNVFELDLLEGDAVNFEEIPKLLREAVEAEAVMTSFRVFR